MLFVATVHIKIYSQAKGYYSLWVAEFGLRMETINK